MFITVVFGLILKSRRQTNFGHRWGRMLIADNIQSVSRAVLESASVTGVER